MILLRPFYGAMAMIVFLAASAFAAENDPATPTPASQPKLDAQTSEVLHDVSDFYQRLNNFKVSLKVSMQLQAPGVKQERWAEYDVVLQKPNKASITLKDGLGATLVSDGRQLYVYVPSLNKYTKQNAPDSLAALFQQSEGILSQGAGNQMLIDSLVQPNPYDALTQDVTSGKYVGLEEYANTRVHHLKLKQRGFDSDLFVEAGLQPFILLVTRDMSSAVSEKNIKLNMSTKLDHWSVNINPGPDAFAFNVPPGAAIATTFGPEDQVTELVGKPVPQTRLDLLGGGNMDLAQNKGKNVVVIDFWATWCAPCTHGLPDLASVANEFKDKGVVVYAINEGETNDVIQKYLSQNPLNLTVALDPNNRVGAEYGITGVPVTVIVGKDGLVKAVHTGLLPNMKQKLSDELNLVIGDKELPSPTESNINTR